MKELPIPTITIMIEGCSWKCRSPYHNVKYFGSVITIPQTSGIPNLLRFRKKSRGARNLAPDPGARNFRIFKTPKKFTSFYSKDFLPKLIFLRKGVHHPKFRIFGGPRKKSGFPEIPEISKSVFSTFWSKFSTFC